MNRLWTFPFIVGAAAASASATDARKLEAEFALAMQDAPAAEIRAAITDAERAAPSGVRVASFLAAVEALAHREGAAALAFAREHRLPSLDPAAIRAAVVRGWTRRDPAATGQWIISVKPAADQSELAHAPAAERFRRSAQSDAPIDAEEADALLHLHLRTAAVSDGERAWRRALAIAETDDDTRARRENYVLTVLEVLIRTGRFERAAALTDELSPAEMRESVRSNLIALTAHHRPDLALHWFAEHSQPGQPDRTGLVLRLGEALAQRRLAEAVRFLRDLPIDERTNDLRDAMIVHACDFDAASIEALFGDLPRDEENLRRLGMLWERVLNVQPQQARGLLAELEFLDEAQRATLEQMR